MCVPIAVASACRKPAATEIPGTYSVHYSFGNEVLTVKAGGEYTQVIAVTGTAPITATGNWTYMPDVPKYHFAITSWCTMATGRLMRTTGIRGIVGLRC